MAGVRYLFGACVATVALCLQNPYAAMVRPQEPQPGKPAADKEAERPSKLVGSWELVDCDYKHTIGYHPELKVSPGYALLMYAYIAVHPKARTEKRALRWRFDENQLVVESVTNGDAKAKPEKVAGFDWVLNAKDKPMLLDLTWRPPGFDGLCKAEKGQKVLGIVRCDEKLEVVLDFSGRARPAAFRPNESCYRLGFRRAKP